ncbi:MAG: alginate lyase family protein [Chloroflexota bacterium]
MPTMNTFAQKLLIGVKAVRQLGWRYTWMYASYRLQLRFGVLRWRTPIGNESVKWGEDFDLNLPALRLPEREILQGILRDASQLLISEANEITDGRVRLFGGEAVKLDLAPAGNLEHWSRHTGYQHNGVDIKFVWEPGRFGWAAKLARAYYLTKEDKYARFFWRAIEEFAQANPPNIGPHWASAQEVGLRLISIVFAAGIFQESNESTKERMQQLAVMLADHAARIPPTLGYARAQNNNHLLTEAAALYTAAVVLPEHPKATRWRKLGWRWLHTGLDTQITTDGVYTQHSTNYHRLMLQTALWVNQLAREQGEDFPESSKLKLAASTQWLFSLLDLDSGSVPNLGSNDGAYILPLTVCDFGDFRPVIQAAGRAFIGSDLLSAGQGDEMASWLAPELNEQLEVEINQPLRLQSGHSWAYLRAESFSSRPSHADQLHFDLWWRGINLVIDGGTFQYNADPPWQNALDLSSLHNTLTVDGLEQMRKTGQFLWLDWAQAEVIGVAREEYDRINWATAQHYGYRQHGVCHQREVSCEGNQWQVRDDILPIDRTLPNEGKVRVRLHWLIRDGDWALTDTALSIRYPQGKVAVGVDNPDYALDVSLARGGEQLAGIETIEPTRGWTSPTYGVKYPALSFAVSAEVKLPTTFITTWRVPD